MDLLSLVANLSGLATLALSLYIYFSDPLRRASFFGYRPTAVIILTDSKSVILIRNHENNRFWYFPQGTIYSSDINQVVNETLNRELAISTIYYKFYKTVLLGQIKNSKDRQLDRKYQPSGEISLFKSTRGKVYLGCLVKANLRTIIHKARLGYGVANIKIVSPKQALKLIDPAKARFVSPLLD